MIDAVCFDMDGLMFNTEELYVQVGQELLGRRGHQLTQELLDQMMGRPSQIALQIMIDFHLLDATVAQLQQETDTMFPAILKRSLQTMPCLPELLDALEANNIPKAIGTSSRRPFMERCLAHFGYESRFVFTLTAENVSQGKPHPEIYSTAAERFGCAPERMLVLEDSENGCRAGVAAGATVVAVPCPTSRAHDFTGVRFVADSLCDPRIAELLAVELKRD